MATASAPASAANLGPGFDVLALALAVPCEVEVVAAADWSVTSDGRPVGESTLALVREMAGDGPFEVFIRSAIPPQRGLGSSAAIRVATAAAAVAERGDSLDRDGLLRAAAVAEGHPDNAAAAVHGGLVLVDAVGGVHRLEIHPSIRVMVAVPAARLSTVEAREVLDDEVPRAVAVRTAARVVALIEGLRHADAAALAAAAGDEIHEAPRAALAPQPADLVAAAQRAGALHACWSGAGPSVLAFVKDTSAAAVRAALTEVLAGEGEVLEPSIDRVGVTIER